VTRGSLLSKLIRKPKTEAEKGPTIWPGVRCNTVAARATILETTAPMPSEYRRHPQEFMTTEIADLDRYTVVDDIGAIINPLLAKGQIQGDVAQGAGQTLSEDIVYDRESGQLLTGSLMDSGMPRADTLPAISVDFSPVPSTTNPLGAKGVGEGGTVASTSTVMNAILDARNPLDVTDLRCLPTPERIWRAIHEQARG
jgi:xanthine dehydrogenase molybdopterin-binding subunit B